MNSGDIAAAIRDVNELSEKLQKLYGSETSSFDVTGVEGAGRNNVLCMLLVLYVCFFYFSKNYTKIL